MIRTGFITPFSKVTEEELTGQIQRSESIIKSPHSEKEDGEYVSEGDIEIDSVSGSNYDQDDQIPDESDINSDKSITEFLEDRYLDDGDEESYQKRLKQWIKQRRLKRAELQVNYQSCLQKNYRFIERHIERG